MNCSETKPQLGCYLDQSLSASEMREIASHLKTCPSCAAEFQHLEKIESVIKAGIFAEPRKDYWTEIPKKITARLGLRTQASVLTQIGESIQALVLGKRFRWGLAGAFAVAAILFFITKTQMPQQGIAPVASQSQGENTPISIAESNTTPDAVRPEPQHQEPADTKTMTAEEGTYLVTTTKIKQKTGEDKQIENRAYLSDELIALNSIKGKPLRDQSIETLGFDQQLYPIPNTEFILPLRDEGEENENNPLLRTFALDSRNARASQMPELSDLPDEIKRIRIGFLETLWIVQESQTLEEKKNIWLSYISRESDITYRSLGVYNLALVLAKITEESKAFGDANEARTFFLKHQKALRFQMGEQRFENKIKIFESILDLY